MLYYPFPDSGKGGWGKATNGAAYYGFIMVIIFKMSVGAVSGSVLGRVKEEALGFWDDAWGSL